MKGRLIVMAFLICTGLYSTAPAQWVATSGPSDGPIECFAVNGNNLYAGTFRGGVFLSTNDGTSWTQVDAGLMDTTVTALAVSGKNLFAGTYGRGVFLSSNDGTSWSPVDSGMTNFTVLSFAVSGTTLLVGTFGGIFLSTNNGTSWTQSGMPDTHITRIAVSDTNLFAGTGGVNAGGVFHSTDNGTTWSEVNTGLSSGSQVSAFAVSGTNIFAATDHGVFLSTNNGASWTTASKGWEYSYVADLEFSGTNIFVSTGFGGFYRSTNNGISWTSVAGPLGLIGPLAISGTNLFAGTHEGIVWRAPLSEMTTSVKGSSAGVPAHFTLGQNYPNPFNPTTVVSFQLPVAGNVKLVVYDMVGREVSVLVNERKDAGVYEVRFDGSNLASGVYYCRIQAGTFLASRPMLLLK